MTEKLRLRDLCVRIGARRIVEAVSFTLREGDIGCLLGASGCGKTTLLRAIAGFEPPAAGEIYLSGRRVGDRKN